MSDPSPRPRRPRVWVIVAILLGLGGVALYAWEEHVEDLVVPRNLGVVEEGKIYRSGRLTRPTMTKVVERHNIKTILDLGAFEPDSEREREQQQIADDLGVQRFRFSLIGDGTGNPNYYVQAIRLINDPRAHPILLQCGAGAQRTGACVVMHRHFVEGQSVRDAYKESFGFRHDPGSDWKMIAYVAEYAPLIERALREGTQVPGFPEVEYPLGDPPIMTLPERKTSAFDDETPITGPNADPASDPDTPVASEPASATVPGDG